MPHIPYSILLVPSLHTSQVAHQTSAYPGFCRMKRLRVFLLPTGQDASPSRGYPQSVLRLLVPVYLPGWREAMSEQKCIVQEHNTMSPARTRTQTARSGDERSNHEATLLS